MTDTYFLEHGALRLRLHRAPDDPALQAWDAADLYALDHLHANDRPGPLLLVNDAFGALACALAGRERTSWSDSELARRALRANERHNALADRAQWRFADVDPDGEFAVAIVKIPRERSLLEHQLARLRPHLRDDALVIGAGMTRLVHASTIAAFERWIGPAPTTPAKRKARLILARVSAPVATPPPPFHFEADDGRVHCIAHAGVFAQRGLDNGTALLLQHLPVRAGDQRATVVADLGCGCGVLGAAMAIRLPGAQVIAADESALAVQSARETFAANGLGRARFLRTDGLDHVADRSVDLVVSNPPQHQHAATSQTLLARVLDEAHRVLRPQGEVWMVANRHVNLNVALHQYFERVRIVAQDRRYMVCAAALPR